MTESPEQEHEHLKQLASSWSARFDQGLQEIIEAEQVDPDKLIMVLWEQGILDRIAPVDEQERDARIALNKAVWPGSREDQELYWRIRAAILSAEESIRKSYTIAGGSEGYITAAMTGFFRVFTEKEVFRQDIWKVEEQKRNPSTWLLRKLESRANEAIDRLGGDSSTPLVPPGTHGRFHDIPVTVKRYLDNGLASLHADDQEGHNRLYEHLQGVSVSAVRLQGNEFTVQTPKQT